MRVLFIPTVLGPTRFGAGSFHFCGQTLSRYMTIFVVPDLHGRTYWQEPAQQFLDSHGPTDQVVFLGNCVDSFEVSNEQQLNNFTDIIAFKKSDPERVVLLLGNHCFQYLNLSRVRLFGFNEDLCPSLHVCYKLHSDLFQVAHQPSGVTLTSQRISRPVVRAGPESRTRGTALLRP